VTKRNTKGVSGRQKLVVQASLGLLAGAWVMYLLPPGAERDAGRALLQGGADPALDRLPLMASW
jgi:hypothetical protein